MDAKLGTIGVAMTGLMVTAGLAGAGSANAASANAASANAASANAASANAVTAVGTKVVYARDDAYTSSTRNATNFGVADKLVVGRSAGETRLSYVKFSTGTLPAGAVVTGAAMKLPLGSKPSAATFSLYRVGTNWSERRITAATAPAMTAAMVSVRPRATDTMLKFDVSKWVTRAGTYAFALRSTATTGVTRLRSVEYGDPVRGGPELDVTYTRPAATKPATAAQPCVTDAKLVPSCGVLWGAAAGGFTDTPRDQALLDWERITGRTATIFHAYHRGNELFPTKSEIAMTRDAARPRVLLLNWKVAYNTTWARVAAGGQDARIDRWADYVKANYRQRFFLALHHEPENDVNPAAGSGMTAKDYAAMYRHVIKRLRADGVTNAINVLAYMGNEKWMSRAWWPDLYPGDDVVDWLGLDSYVNVEKGYHYGDFGDVLDRQPSGGGLGWYDWAVKNHPAKPIIVAEWGMYHRRKVKTDKSAAFNTVIPELATHPKVKAIVYFDTASDDEGDRDISVNSLPSSLTAVRKVAANPIFNVKLGR